MYKRFGFIFLALVILVAAIGYSATPAQAATCTQWYTVKKGDNLYQIGLKFGVSWTYLAEINQISNPGKIYAGQVICVSTTGSTSQTPTGTIPTFSIVGVKRDVSVTIQTRNFPANDIFDVLMGPYGTQGIGGIKVGTYQSGNGASKVVTYNIPAALKGDYRIAIRLQSSTGSGFFAYNWFYNNTTGGATGGGGVSGSYSGYPYFFIAAVQRNSSVTINGYNYPPNTQFTVYMGPNGTKGVGGYYVTSFNSGAGGNISKTFPIPPELYGSTKIAIRTQGNVFYAYNWFWNTTAVAP